MTSSKKGWKEIGKLLEEKQQKIKTKFLSNGGRTSHTKRNIALLYVDFIIVFVYSFYFVFTFFLLKLGPSFTQYIRGYTGFFLPPLFLSQSVYTECLTFMITRLGAFNAFFCFVLLCFFLLQLKRLNSIHIYPYIVVVAAWKGRIFLYPKVCFYTGLHTNSWKKKIFTAATMQTHTIRGSPARTPHQYAPIQTQIQTDRPRDNAAFWKLVRGTY